MPPTGTTEEADDELRSPTRLADRLRRGRQRGPSARSAGAPFAGRAPGATTWQQWVVAVEDVWGLLAALPARDASGADAELVLAVRAVADAVVA